MMWKLTTQQQSDQEDSRNERGVHTAVPDAWCFDDGGAAHTETFIEALIELQKFMSLASERPSSVILIMCFSLYLLCIPEPLSLDVVIICAINAIQTPLRLSPAVLPTLSLDTFNIITTLYTLLDLLHTVHVTRLSIMLLPNWTCNLIKLSCISFGVPFRM